MSGRRNVSKLRNQYDAELGDLYAKTPKAVLAAIAVSGLTCGGDRIEEARARVLFEWWALYENRIVPQRPPFPRPADPDVDL